MASLGPSRTWPPAAGRRPKAFTRPDARKEETTGTGRPYAVHTVVEHRHAAVQARCRSSEPQVVTTQLVDGPAAHQLHVPFDFGTEISKGPLDAGLTRGRQGI
jgi:hypothetical protein